MSPLSACDVQLNDGSAWFDCRTLKKQCQCSYVVNVVEREIVFMQPNGGRIAIAATVEVTMPDRNRSGGNLGNTPRGSTEREDGYPQ